MNSKLMFHTVALVISLMPALAQQTPKRPQRNPLMEYPPKMAGAMAEVYKTVGDVKLNIFIFTPAGHKSDDKRAAIIFFFGGGWTSGSPGQFAHQCEYLASRGMVAMTTDYRVASRHHVKPVQCDADAKSAIRWVRANAKRLGVDPDHIAASGGSAGGHLAGAVGTIKGLDEKGEDASVSSMPNAMVMFNPALVLAPLDGKEIMSGRTVQLTEERFGIAPTKLSPCHNVRAGTPPAIIFHGKADTTVPYATAEAFAEAMKKAGNRCDLVGFDGQSHGFFNFGRNENKYFIETVRKADQFLASLGYLKGEPTIDEFVKSLK